jgi:hypothetical protein
MLNYDSSTHSIPAVSNSVSLIPVVIILFSSSQVLSSLSEDAFDILVSVICGDYTALVRGRAMKLLFKTTLDGAFP